MNNFWTLENLYTAISKENIEKLFGKIRPGNMHNRAYKRIVFCCDKAKNIVMDILSSSYVEEDFADNVPEIVQECVVVLAATYLLAESDMDDCKESLQKRFKDGKQSLMMLRDFRITPKISGGQNKNNAVYFGVGNKEL